MGYTPGQFPKDAPPWITREFRAVQEATEAAIPAQQYNSISVEPQKPREGMMVYASGTWDPGYGEGPYFLNSALQWVPMFGASVGDGAIVACSDESTALTTGTKRTFYAPYNLQIDEIITDVVTAPTGAAIIVDVKVGGASILSTKPQIEVSETSSLTGTAAVISSPSVTKGSKIELVIDQVGSTVAGAGLKVALVWRRVS